ncbi:unnamed protein product [Schistosoma curassoni]|uniref:Uncharacterized protein n=1 Tax=Schistosoma curassoni TaxID=6186 RepID=A0A183K452_9TREM|nr:unnamed protein product [Schistosoma curassoni]
MKITLRLTDLILTDYIINVSFHDNMKFNGFSINNATFSTLVLRFSRRDGSVPFDSYVICCARLQTLFEVFKVTPKNDKSQALFTETDVSHLVFNFFKKWFIYVEYTLKLKILMKNFKRDIKFYRIMS